VNSTQQEAALATRLREPICRPASMHDAAVKPYFFDVAIRSGVPLRSRGV